jgi:hypothetical protein
VARGAFCHVSQTYGAKRCVNRIERWPLLRAMHEFAGLVQSHNPQEEVEVGLIRVPLPRFASETIRELIANALVHRDYTERGAVRVEIEDGNLSITSPGGFPEGISPSNILLAPPRPVARSWPRRSNAPVSWTAPAVASTGRSSDSRHSVDPRPTIREARGHGSRPG